MRLKVVAIAAASAAVVIGIVMLSLLRTTIGKARQEKASSSLTLDAFRFPVEVVSTEVKHGTDLDIRFVFLYVHPSDFIEQNLNTLFTSLATEYQDPQFMHITAYSDREMLQRAISRSQDQDCGVWPVEKLPAKSGYFSAQYSRRDDAEFFDYTPDPEKPESMRVWFRTPTPRPD